MELPIGCDVKVVSWQLNDAAELMEKCEERVGKNNVVPVPESIHGMRNLSYKNPQLWKEVNETCNDFVGKVDSCHPPHDVDSKLLESPDLYPVKKSKNYPRKKAHSWLDQPVAHYSSKHRSTNRIFCQQQTQKAKRPPYLGLDKNFLENT